MANYLVIYNDFKDYIQSEVFFKLLSGVNYKVISRWDAHSSFLGLSVANIFIVTVPRNWNINFCSDNTKKIICF